jgi:hypothetical protein
VRFPFFNFFSAVTGMAGEKPEQKEHWNDWIAKKTGKSESPASRREQKSRNDMQE